MRRIPRQSQPVTRSSRTDCFDMHGEPQWLWDKVKSGWNKIKCRACRSACNLISNPLGKTACNLACDRTVC